MADLPIIFSRPMVLALMSGRKTVTRRILKPQPRDAVIRYGWERDGGASWTDQHGNCQPLRFWAGDRLYVRERARFHDGRWEYAADRPDDVELSGQGYRPSIHMPRVASRMTLMVTDVKVERLQEISPADALAEGIFAIRGPDNDGMRHFAAGAGEKVTRPTPEKAFAELWRAINGPESWDENPWVAAIRFDVVRRNIADLQPFA